MSKPYFRRSEGIEKGTYIRVGRSTVHATPAMIEELKWQSHRIDFEKLPVYQCLTRQPGQSINPKFS